MDDDRQYTVSHVHTRLLRLGRRDRASLPDKLGVIALFQDCIIFRIAGQDVVVYIVASWVC